VSVLADVWLICLAAWLCVADAAPLIDAGGAAARDKPE
jgi:hypothetical protein